jgi:superfamily II DNA or RNA helicase
VVASHICLSGVRQGKRGLFVAHRRELIKQSFCKLVRNGIDPRQVGIVMGDTSGKLCDDVALPVDACTDEQLWEMWARRRPGAPMQVCSIDTLRNRAKIPADFIIIDEAHRSLSRSYVELCEEYPQAVILGLTATPFRADNRGLGELYEDLVEIAQYSELIRDGFILEPTILTVDAKDLPDLSQVSVKRGGDYDERELAEAVDKARLVGNIVDHWKEHAQGVRTVAFAASVAHSRHIAEAFNRDGVRAEHLDGESPTEERDAILRRLASGETRLVSNCAVLQEGWDMPIVACCILARPTKSLGLYMQEAGRVLRPCDGKPFALILDHAACYAEHGSPTEDREYSLDSPKRRKKKATTSVTVCPECGAAVESGSRECPACGCVLIEARAGRAAPEEVDGKLVLVTKTAPDERRAYWDALCASRGSMGPGWVHLQYLNRFGTKPPVGWKVPLSEEERRAQDAEDSEKKERLRALIAEATRKGWKPGAAQMRFKAEFGFFPPGRWTAECQPRDQRSLFGGGV